MQIFRTLTLAALVAGGTQAAQAQDAMAGAEIFADRCAVCHGDSGAGDGLVGELFAQKPGNLRTLARDNGGVYPFEEVFMAIGGVNRIAAHGHSEMPIWGEALMEEALEERGIDPKDAGLIVQGRVLALTYYIQTLQLE